MIDKSERAESTQRHQEEWENEKKKKQFFSEGFHFTWFYAHFSTSDWTPTKNAWDRTHGNVNIYKGKRRALCISTDGTQKGTQLNSFICLQFLRQHFNCETLSIHSFFSKSVALSTYKVSNWYLCTRKKNNTKMHNAFGWVDTKKKSWVVQRVSGNSNYLLYIRTSAFHTSNQIHCHAKHGKKRREKKAFKKFISNLRCDSDRTVRPTF